MKLIDARINWSKNYDNSPTLQLLVDKIPPLENLRYQERNGIFYSELEGYVSFFYYRSAGEGYGGRKFLITMTDGTKKELIGPWSSRAGAVNSVGFGPCVDVSIADNLESYKRGYTFLAGAVTLDITKQAAKIADCDLVCEFEQDRTTVKMSGEQSRALREVVSEFSDISILSTLKYPVYGDVVIHPFVKEKCVCGKCNCIRIGDRFVKEGKTCHTCGAEQYKKDKSYPKDWDTK